MTDLVLLGDPVEHSLSPAIYAKAFELWPEGDRPSYAAWRVAPARLKATVEDIRAHAGILGGNVTVPHKEAILPLLDEVDDRARQLGAVNCFVRRNGKLVGTNTDGVGLYRALPGSELLSGRWRSQRAVVLGAGGAARAAAFVLALQLKQSVTILNRTRDRADALAEAIRKAGGKATSGPLDIASVLRGLGSEGILVNATSVGLGDPKAAPVDLRLAPMIGAPLTASHRVVDLVYEPLETALLAAARKAGAVCVDGLAVLAEQAVASLHEWFGEKYGWISPKRLREVAIEAQKRRGLAKPGAPA